MKFKNLNKENTQSPIYYRFTIGDSYGDTGSFFRSLNNILDAYYEEGDEYSQLDEAAYELELITPAPPEGKIVKNSLFAYKKSFVNKNKEKFSNIKKALENLGYKLITTKIKNPSNIIYEDEVQIAYI